MSGLDQQNSSNEKTKPQKLLIVEKALHAFARAQLYNDIGSDFYPKSQLRNNILSYLHINSMSINTFALEQTLSAFALKHLSDFVERLYTMVKNVDDERHRHQTFLVWARECECDPIMRQLVSQVCRQLQVKQFFSSAHLAFLETADVLLRSERQQSSQLYIKTLETISSEYGLNTFLTLEKNVLSIYGRYFLLDFSSDGPDEPWQAKLIIVHGNQEKPVPQLDAPLKQLAGNPSVSKLQQLLYLLSQLDSSSSPEINLVEQLVTVLSSDMEKVLGAMGILQAEIQASQCALCTIKPSFPLWKSFRQSLNLDFAPETLVTYHATVSFERSERSMLFPRAEADTKSFLDINESNKVDFIEAPLELVLNFDPPIVFCLSLAQRLWYFALDSFQSPIFVAQSPNTNYFWDLLTYVTPAEAVEFARVADSGALLTEYNNAKWISTLQVASHFPCLRLEMVTETSAAQPGSANSGYCGIIVRRLPLKLFRKLEASISVLKGQIMFNELIKTCLFTSRYQSPLMQSETATVKLCIFLSKLTIVMKLKPLSKGDEIVLTVMIKSKPVNPQILVTSSPPIDATLISQFEKLLARTQELPVAISFLLSKLH